MFRISITALSLAVLAGCAAAVPPGRRAPPAASDPKPRPAAVAAEKAAGAEPGAESDTVVMPVWAAGYLRIDLRELAAAVVAEANVARRRAGAPPLRPERALMQAAREYSRELARRGDIDHQSATPGRRTFRDRIAAAGASARIAGENLAQLTAIPAELPAQVVSAWLRSPGHRANLLDDLFRRTGVGVMLGADGVWYVTQVYASVP